MQDWAIRRLRNKILITRKANRIVNMAIWFYLCFLLGVALTLCMIGGGS